MEGKRSVKFRSPVISQINSMILTRRSDRIASRKKRRLVSPPPFKTSTNLSTRASGKKSHRKNREDYRKSPLEPRLVENSENQHLQATNASHSLSDLRSPQDDSVIKFVQSQTTNPFRQLLGSLIDQINMLISDSEPEENNA